MNTGRDSTSHKTMAFGVSFNSTKIAVTIAHDAGLSIFRLASGERMASSSTTPLRFASMIGESRYTGLASLFGSGPRLAPFDVAVFDSNSKKMLVTIDDVRTVRTIHFAKDRMILVCRMATYFYDTDVFQKVAVLDTALNEHGLCSIGVTKVAIPGRTMGQVQVVDLKTCRAQQIIAAHQSAIKAIDLSDDEQYLATASETGTLFRIFLLSDSNATKVAELRRGLEPARVFSIQMSPDNQYLAVTSEKGTLHVFSLSEQSAETEYIPGHKTSGSPEPIPVPQSSRKTSLTGSPVPVGGFSSSLKSAVPASKSPTPQHMMAGSPAEYVMVDTSMPTARETAKSGPTKKYGTLSKLPFRPSFMKAHYPDASTEFNVGAVNAAAAAQEVPGLSTRGQLQWIDHESFVVVRVQPTVLWEKFKVSNSAIDGTLGVHRSAYAELSIP